MLNTMLDNSRLNGETFMDSQMLTLSYQVTKGTLDSCSILLHLWGLYYSNPAGNTVKMNFNTE